MKILSDLPRNSRNCLKVEPLWALFGGVIIYFAPLYMKELGLSDIEMGLVNSAGLLASFFFFILAGPFTNKYGRRITSLIWDMSSWSVSTLIWAFARGFAWFLVAILFNSAVRVVMVSWNLLLTEDARENQRVRIYSIVYLIGSVGGFMTLAAGLLLDHYGVLPTMRVTYLLAFVFMTSMFIIRYSITRETENGLVMIEKTRDTPLRKLVAEQLRSLAHAARDRHFFVLTLIFLIAAAVQSFTFFQILYLKDNLGYSNAELALVPAVNSLLSIFLFSVVLPRVSKTAERLGLLVGFILCFAGGLAFLFLGSGMIFIVLLIQGLSASAFLLLSAYRDSVFMNSVASEQRAELFGLVNMLAMLLSIPTGALAGWLFSLTPLAPFAAVVLLFAAGGAATWRLMSWHRRGPARAAPSSSA
jgi:Na+/melibiose symporter-like transporter